jgi:hypothetical protein
VLTKYYLHMLTESDENERLHLAIIVNRGGILKMGSLSVVVQQLRKERERVQKEVHRIDVALTALANVSVNGSKPRKFSAITRRRMAIAQRARWAKQKAQPRRKMSAAGRRRIAAAQRARWAKAKTRE